MRKFDLHIPSSLNIIDTCLCLTFWDPLVNISVSVKNEDRGKIIRVLNKSNKISVLCNFSSPILSNMSMIERDVLESSIQCEP